MLLSLFFCAIFSIVISLIFSGSVLMVGLYALLMGVLVSLLIAWLFSPWFGMISILVYVGGLMVMFGYFLAICPNQVMKGGKEWVKVGLPAGLVGGVYAGGLSSNSEVFWSETPTSLSVFYSGEGGGVLVILGGFLLMALVSVVKVVRLKQGPFRPFVV